MANNFDIDVTLNTAKVKAQMAALNQDLKKTQTAAGGVGGALSGAGNALATKGNPSLANFGKLAKAGGLAVAGMAAAAVAAVAAIVSSQMQALDSLAKTADQIDIGVETLQAWRFAAEQTGSSAGVLDGALLRLNRRLGLAAEGGGAAVKSLERLGLSADSLIDMGTEQAFKTIADRISEIPTQAERAAVGVGFFGNEAQQLLGLLNSGSEGLSDFQKRAEELGLTVSRLDLTRIEETNDTINEIKTAFKGLSQQFTVEIMPLIQMLAEDFLGLAEGAGGFQEAFRTATRAIAFGIGAIKDGFAGIQIFLKGLQNGFDVLGVGALYVFKGIVSGVEGLINGAINLINNFISGANRIPGVNISLINTISIGALDAVEKQIDATKDRIVKRSGEINEALSFAAGGGNSRQMLDALNERYAKLDANAGSAADNAERMAAAQREQTRLYREEQSLEKERAALAERNKKADEEAAKNEAARAGRIADAIKQLERQVQLESLLSEEQRKQLQLEFQIQDLNANETEADKLRTLNEQIAAQQRQNELLREQEAAIGNLGEALGRWAVTGKDAIASVIAEMIRLIAISQFGGTGNFLGGLLNGLGSIQGFANGGRPPVNQVSLVGERGPELFVPDTAGRIIPNESISFGGTSGMSVTAQYNFNGNIYGVDDLQTELDRNNAQVAQMVERIMLKQARTGGLYGR